MKFPTWISEFTVFRAMQFSRWYRPITISAAIVAGWDLVASQLLPDEWPIREFRLWHGIEGIAKMLPAWAWVTILLTLTLIACVEYLGAKLNEILALRSLDKLQASIEKTVSQFANSDNKLAAYDEKLTAQAARIDRLRDCLIAREKLQTINSVIEWTKSAIQKGEFGQIRGREWPPFIDRELRKGVFGKHLEEAYRRQNIDPISIEAQKRPDIWCAVALSFLEQMRMSLNRIAGAPERGE